MDTAPANAATNLISDEEKRRIIIGVLLALLLAALDQTIVAPAVPVIGAALGDVAYLSWIVSAYFLTATAVTPLYGKLADMRGRRGVLFAAIGIFVAGSVVCALAPSMLVLVLGRALQGLGGGGLIALAQIVIADVVTPRERGRYSVYISMAWGTASVAGPVVGGFFAQHLHWSLIFWINIPLAALAVLMTNRTLRRLPDLRHPQKLDALGAVLIVLATVAFMLLLTWGGARFAWTSWQSLGLAAAAAVLAGLFAARLAVTSAPLIPLTVLANPVIRFATLSVFFGMGVNIGLSVYVPLYLEMAHGLQAAQAGAALVAYLGASVVGANLAGRTMARAEHYKWLAVAGAALAVAGLVVLTFGAASFSVLGVESVLCVTGFGLGAQFPITTVSVQNAAPLHAMGVATSLVAFLRSLGSAIGVSVLGAILLASGLIHESGDLARAAGAVTPEGAAAAGHAFGFVFAACAMALVLSFACLLAMEEVPLRAHASQPEAPQPVES